MDIRNPIKTIDIEKYGAFGRTERAVMIQELPSSLYSGTNAEGADIIVLLENGVGMEVLTFQTNGWLRSDEYDEQGMHQIETYQGRWRQPGEKI